MSKEQVTSGGEVARPELGTVHLLKTMRWYDGFIVCLSASGFLISTLGYSIGALGALGALVLWVISILIGALQTRIFCESSTMFPDASGGLAVFVREGWRRRINILAPFGGFAYWIAYTSGLATFGLLAASLIQAQWLSGQTWTLHIGPLAVGFVQTVAAMIIVVVWTINVSGMRPTRWFGYVTGLLFMAVLIGMAVLPYLTGHFNPGLLKSHIGEPGQDWGGLRLCLVWLYLMGWSSYPSEQAASFAPEYRDAVRDTSRGLMSSAFFAVGVFTLAPLGLGGVLSDKVIAADPVGFYVGALDKMLGSNGGAVGVAAVVIACLLTMNAATMNASRALYGISRRGHTLRIFGTLNRARVPGHAMTFDMVSNVILVIVLGSVIKILAASNMAYFVAVSLALGGVALLRVDAPDAERPIRLARRWIVMAVVLAIFNLVLLVVGSVSFQITGYGDWSSFWIGLGALALGMVFFLVRVFIEDRTTVQWRDRSPVVTVSLRGLEEKT